jgi:glycosyltransferase involved in cell wall biosynthesis
MRVGFLTYGLDRNPTGIGRYALELLRALSKEERGPEIVILATEGRDTIGLSELGEYHELRGCRTLPALMTYGNTAVRRAATSRKLDLIHDPNGIAPFLMLPRSVRSVVTLHDAFAFIHPEEHNHLDNWRYRWYLPAALRRTDRVITPSLCSFRDLVRYLSISEEKIDVIHEGVDERFSFRSDSAESPDGTKVQVLDRYGITGRYFLYIGAINGRKNIVGLLRAFSRVRESDENVQLVIVGKRQWKAGGIDHQIESLGIRNAVHFTGFVTDADLPQIYRSALAFVFPSFYEGFGLPPLEAMACGTPVITSNRSSIPEVTSDAAILIDPFNTEELAAAMNRVNQEPDLRRELTRRGIQRAAEFRWSRTAAQTAAVYRSCLEASPLADIADSPLETR